MLRPLNMKVCAMMSKEAPMREVEGTAKAISDMKVRGAANIARAASGALSTFASAWKGKDRDAFVSDLKKAALKLHSARPTAVSLRNGIELTLSGAESGATVEDVRTIVVRNSKRFIASSEEALRRIAEIGKGRIPPGATVMTHCNSMAALSVIHAAFLDGKVSRVFATESRPWRQGHLTVKWLAERGVPVSLIVDPAVRHFMKAIDVVIVGADTVAANGAVINKIGTSQIALCAKESRVPFVVCAETFKFSKETLLGALVEIEERGPEEVADPLRPSDLPGVEFRNPVFDATPPEYIDAIVTEVGVVSPYSAAEVIKEMFSVPGPVLTDGDRSRSSWI